MTTTSPLPHQPVATVLGYPRIGRARELKRATEAYWAGDIDATQLRTAAAAVRRSNWETMAAAGITEVPCNDFSLYDHMLDMAQLVDAVPARHRGGGDVADSPSDLDELFAMARGTAAAAPLEMTKWFDTNYHYLVPELGPGTTFALRPGKVLGELREAVALGLDARPVLIGPLTFLQLSKARDDAPTGFDTLSLLDRLVDVYAELLPLLAKAGAHWVQLDEPVLVTDLGPGVLDAAARAYDTIGEVSARPQLLVATYFDVLGDAMGMLRAAPVEGVALDLIGRAARNLDQLAAVGGLPDKRLVAGVIDGRNVWANDLTTSLSTLATLLGLAGEVVVAPSCSLLHVPIDVAAEHDLDPTIASWLAFADQKLIETATLARGIGSGTDAIAAELDANRSALASRMASPLTSVHAVRNRAAALAPADEARASEYERRVRLQRDRLDLPLLPTTTIGSFPQTAELRRARAQLRAGSIDADAYAQRMRDEIGHVIALQEQAGLDVLVHGEPERNDMVQYFAELLEGFVATRHAWVQSYGSRYVRPPILLGDVARRGQMTVEWADYARAQTDRPLKGMLTGPITILCWSFVRDDLPLADVAVQVALALRDEVADLEAAGLPIIQVDEPALREGLPLRRADHGDYLRWATRAFRVATSGVWDVTQIHTHMCYAEFGDILGAIMALDADVISLEAARSRMHIVHELAEAGYRAQVGPGVYDVHAPHVPSAGELTDLIEAAVAALPAEQIWVNPDCGLKTRREEEVVAALTNMVAAARAVRQRLTD